MSWLFDWLVSPAPWWAVLFLFLGMVLAGKASERLARRLRRLRARVEELEEKVEELKDSG